jgi:predicted nuclease with TOPRIM domain
MNEKTGGSFSIDTYLAKQEGLLLEHIRRMLQAETKITLLEAALQDMYKRNEELSQQNETTKLALDQAINGLTAVTNEKDRLGTKVNDLEQSLKSTRNDLNSALIYKGEVDKLNGKLSVAETNYNALKQNYDIVLENYNAAKAVAVEVDKLNEKLSVAETNYSALKQNYDIVLENYNAAKAIEAAAAEATVTVEKKKKVKSTESEWTDGKY